ncbi:MAG TPA: beta-propeller fold lactonase family protein [Candidatus Limnocylindrales bacterium]|nr:beta-propeller fold lactonase family protein [Candidatus Limnocylindrales bacterium]
MRLRPIRVVPGSAAIVAVMAVAVVFAFLAFTLSAKAKPDSDEARYLNPREMVLSPDGHRLYVMCEGSDEVRIVDASSGKVLQVVAVGHMPRGISLSPDGRQIYVANSWDDTLSVIDASSLKVVRTLATGFEPNSVVSDREGKTLYVANRLSSDISVIDLESGQEIKRLLAGRGASYLALSADGKLLYCTHVYPRIGAHRTPPESEVTVIDTDRQRVIERKPLHNVGGVFHIALSADGKLGVAPQLRPKNLVPLAHVEHGWAFGDSLALFGEDVGGGVVQVPIDELDRYFAMPYAVAITPDKSKLYVSSSGADSITVIDIPKMLSYVHAASGPIANDLSASANYVLTRIPVGRNPKGLLLSGDGKRLYVANRLDDSISVIDTNNDVVVSSIDLGGKQDMTSLRRGERIFYTARFAFQGQFSCANCHIDATFDGLQWDLEPDGFGVDIVDNRSIEDLSGTEPFKWNGGNPNMATECGPRTEKYFYRSQSYNSAELADLVSYVMALPLRPNRYRLPAGELTPAQERGKAIFERKTNKFGKAIAESNQCAYCHSGPKYTNQKLADVGTGKKTDRSPLVDVPQLTNVAYSGPYLHDGSARSMEEIWTIFNPKDTHGFTNDLTKDELNDLIEYLRTL